MDRMEHVSGKIVDGDRLIFDYADGYLGCHDVGKGRKSYFGYFELAPDRLAAVDQATRYRLVLKDGRAGDVFAEVLPSSTPGLMLAEFHVSGGLTR